MKNRFFFFCLMAVMTVSCAKEQQEVIQMITNDPVFHATIENAGTRVYADNQLRVLWNADDHVSIFNKTTYNREYAFQGKDGDNSGTFKKVPNDDFVTSNPLDYVYSVYPYNENTSISNDGEITVYLPSEQTYRENSFGLGANTMIAIAEDDELMFKNLCGYFELKLYGDDVYVKSISLRGNNNECLAGKAMVVAQMDKDPELTFETSEALKEITLVFNKPRRLGSTAESAKSFMFVIPPTVFENGITLTVQDEQGYIFSKTTSGSLDIRRNILKKTEALEVETHPKNVIYYTSTDGNIVTPYKTDDFGANIISNEYSDGRGVITFDKDLWRISYFAFRYCSTLSSIDIPRGVTEIGDGAFERCENLSQVNIPDGVTCINAYTFSDCKGLDYIGIPNSVTRIEENAFWGCGLKSVFIPDSVTSISDYSFSSCLSLLRFDGRFASEDGLYLTDSGKIIAVALGSVDGNVTIPNGVTIIGKSAFNNCNSITGISLPNGVTTIETSAFRNCFNLSSVDLPTSLTTIEDTAFDSCWGLNSIAFPNSLTTIGNWSFHGCNSLTEVSLPKCITIVGERAFSECRNLNRVCVLADNPPAGSEDVLLGSDNALIYVPALSVEAYKRAQYWETYADRIKPLTPLPEAVDLGLSVKWASFNLGASDPEGYGDYYAWGELACKDDIAAYTQSNYKFYENGEYTKYTVNGKMALDSEDDAATVCLGDHWRMPSREEYVELFNTSKTSSKWTTMNGVVGWEITSKANGNSIFIPAGGQIHDGRLDAQGQLAFAWTRDLYLYNNTYAYAICIYDTSGGTYIAPKTYINETGNLWREMGLPIRPIYVNE